MAAPEMPADLPDAADALPHDERGEDTAAVARAPVEVSLAPRYIYIYFFFIIFCTYGGESRTQIYIYIFIYYFLHLWR